jgi:SAM-dependent methyltransferase
LRGDLAGLRSAVARLEKELEQTARIEDQQRMTQAVIAGLELATQDLFERVEAAESLVEAKAAESEDALASHGERLALQAAELRAQRARIELVLREARRVLAAPDGHGPLLQLSEALASLESDDYDALETLFRGSRDSVAEKQRKYLADIEPLRGLAAPFLDVGCGRGEWLELMREANVQAYGVDVNDRFVRDARERGLDARKEDAIEHLASLPESSLAGLTAFHLIEHLEVDTGIRVLDLALHALRPRGLLLLETPNPANLSVGAGSFYLDPTHVRPVHPEFLSFLLSSRGFVDVETRFIHPGEAPRLPSSTEGELRAQRIWTEHVHNALFGPRDYAVLARKPAPTT